ARADYAGRDVPTVAHHCLLRRTLVDERLLSDVFPAPLRRASNVHHAQGLGAVFPPLHLPEPRVELPEPKGLRDPAPNAPCLFGRTEGSALTGAAEELLSHDEPHPRHLPRHPARPHAGGGALHGAVAGVAGARSLRAWMGVEPSVGRCLYGVLPRLRDRVVALLAAAGALLHGPRARRDRQLVRPLARLPQLRREGCLSQHAAVRFRDVGGAVPEQPPPLRVAPALRR